MNPTQPNRIQQMFDCDLFSLVGFFGGDIVSGTHAHTTADEHEDDDDDDDDGADSD